MKALKLTKEHKEKLLEMCNKLFPEYIITFNINALEYGTFMVTNNGETIIHWFEFCMTHLVDKIFESFEEDDEDFYDRYINNGALFYGVGVSEIIFVMLNSKKHPVDYLYEEFKKLEN